MERAFLAELAEVVVTQLPAAFILVDGRGDVVVASAATDELFGRPVSDDRFLLRRYPLLRPDGESFHEAERPILAALRSGQRVMRELEISGMDGQARTVVVSASPLLRSPGERWALGVFFDVTELRAAEAEREALLDQVTRLQRVTSALSRDLSPDDVVRTVITQVTAAMDAWAGGAALLGDDGLLHHTGSHGYSQQVVEPYRSFPLDADNLLAAAARTRQPQVCGSAEEVLARHPSLRSTIEITRSEALVALPLVVDQRLLGAIGFSFRDRRTFDERDLAFFSALAEQCAQALDRASAYRRLHETTALLEDKVRELAEAHERERRFTADLAHDLRNPATAVMTAACVFREAEELPEDLSRFVRPLLSGARSLRILLDDLLDMARLEAGRHMVEREPVDVAALADDIVHGLPWDHPIRFVAQPARIVSDHRRVARILANLVENAVTYGCDGIEVDVAAGGEGATVVVRDHGPGIPPDQLERIFDRYYTAGRTQSTGLGLSIALENAHLLGGRIDARSTPGTVTEFVVHLPSLDDGSRR
jgi:signal transduction histidine kinase